MAALHTHVFGPDDGQNVLALHGVQGHGRRFEELAASLPGYQVFAPDLRGHGHSLGETPYDMDEHGLERVAVIGHSFGGNLTTRLIERAPDRVSRAILLDPALSLDSSFTTAMTTAAIAGETYGSLEELLVARRATAAASAAERIDRDTHYVAVQRADGSYARRFVPAAVVVAWSEMSRPAAVIATPCPALVVIGDRAKLVGDRQIRDLESQFGELLSVAHLDCGHMVYWEEFEETVRLVSDFLANEPSSRPRSEPVRTT
jgi:lipase